MIPDVITWKFQFQLQLFSSISQTIYQAIKSIIHAIDQSKAGLCQTNIDVG